MLSPVLSKGLLAIQIIFFIERSSRGNKSAEHFLINKNDAKDDKGDER